MTEDKLVSLLFRQLSGDLDSKEMQELTAWAEQDAVNQQFLEHISNQTFLEREINCWWAIDPARGYKKWKFYYKARRKGRIFRLLGSSAAACLLIALSISIFVKPSKPFARTLPTISETELPIQAGRSTATLTLSNGKKVLLDSAAKGNLAVDGNARLVKPDSSSLSYVPTGPPSENVVYNILTTPRAGQYQLTLSDGSRVWLNNVSSLRYPTFFQEKNRTVELTGEAYFEIAKDPFKPFIVKIDNQTVQVLGTSFNIMAYPEEDGTQTTLVTGAIRVALGSGSITLKPNEQARVNSTGKLSVLKEMPVDDIVSWKNGFFYFGRASFASVMRQLTRWYNIDVMYEGRIPEMEFGGKIDRGLPLNELLKYLNKNQVHFRLDGRKLIVSTP